MNEVEITVAGRVVADPEHRETGQGRTFTTFRIASTVRRRNREGVFVDVSTSFYNVAAFRSLGMNSHGSLRKGDPVVVHGRLTINSWQRADDSWGSSADIEAVSVGHDLTFGTTEYAKASRGVVDSLAQEAGAHGLDRMTERYEQAEGPAWGGPAPSTTPDGETSAGEGEGEDTPVAVPA